MKSFSLSILSFQFVKMTINKYVLFFNCLFKYIRLITAVFLMFLSFFARAQNIANPDFEIFNLPCPSAQSQFNGKVTSWTTFTTVGSGTPDYFNSCGTYNLASYSPPILANSGNGFAGIYLETNSSSGFSDYKEYFTTQLSAPLVAGVTYAFSFYTAHLIGAPLPGSAPGALGYLDLPDAEQGYLGAVFSTVAPALTNTGNGSGGNPRYNSIRDDFGSGRALVPKANTAVYGVASQNNWVKVTLYYTAVGGEQYMTIGQFRPGGTSLPVNYSSYYLFDNFSTSLVPNTTLTKSVSPATIPSGGTATYTFTLNNTAVGNVAQTGLTFTDNLPSGLRLAANPNVVVTGLTGGTVSAVSGGNSIIVSGYNQAANSTATITVDVTNMPGQGNLSCGSNPAAFTNTAANISSLSANITNNVGDVCLVVSPMPFTCNSDIFLIQDANTALYGVVTSTNPFTFPIIGSPAGYQYNASGVNPLDGYMYAMKTFSNNLLRIDASGAITDMGVVTGLPAATGTTNYNSGEIDHLGNYYIKSVGSNSTLYRVNINTRVATAISLSQATDPSDIAYSISTGLLYGVGTNGRLFSINPSGGTVTFIGTSPGAAVFGALFGSSTGHIYGINNAGDFYEFDLTNGSRTVISSAPSSSNNDGAHCVTAPITFQADLSVTQTDGESTYTPGTNKSYTVVVTNNGPFGVLNANLINSLPSGIPNANMSYTAVASNGSVTSISGTQTGPINDLISLAVNGTITYNITIAVPASFTGDLVNTASVTPPTNITDANLSNNQATDTNVSSCSAGVDSDGDGIGDFCDLDDDNDGILDSEECGGVNKISNGVFPTSGGDTDTYPGWTIGGTYGGAWPSSIGRVNFNSRGLEFKRDANTITTFSQNLTGVFSYNNATINLNALYWYKTLNGNSADSEGILTVSYAGVIYATINTTVGNTPTITGNNGAMVNITTLPAITTNGAYSTPTNLSITLPKSIPSSGEFLLTFTAGSNSSRVRDIGMASISFSGCADTDGDGIPDYLDLDSDNDGCVDAREGNEGVRDEMLTAASGTLSVGTGSAASNQNLGNTVDSQGVPTIVNAGGSADVGADQGQGIGASKNAAVNFCVLNAPGGVAGPDFWVKSDDAGTIATAWKDHSANENNIPNVGAVVLSPADRAHNFHPYTTGYTTTKYFYNTTSLMNPLGNVELPNTNTSIFSAVRPTTVNGTGRITGIDDEANAAEPGISINAGRPRHYEFTNSVTQTEFSSTFNTGVSNVFSAIANNSIANGGTSASSGGEKILGLNGTYETTSFTGTNKFQILGRHLRIGYATFNVNGPFPGDIMEVVWYKRALTANEQSRVNTYLAVKNGTTLNENYLSTASNVVWDRTLNTGYNNNIFGIARDNITALHQKQAGSTNNAQQLVISTTGLADNNAANSTGLTNDMQYLMTGDNGLKQSLLVPLTYTAGSNGQTNYRFESIWKVQNSGSVGTVTVAWPKGVNNLYLVQSPDAAFDETDTFTPMATEVTVNGTAYNTANVTLSNGQFFTFAGFVQAPGGVAGPDFWVKSDDAGTIATAWKDHSANQDDIPNEGGMTLSSANRAHNFHPYTSGYSNTKYFYNTNSLLNFTNTFTDPSMRSSVSIFSAVRPTTTNGTGRITGIDDDVSAAEPGVSISSGRPYIYKYYGNGGAQANNNIMSVANTMIANESAVFSAIQDQALNVGRGERRLGLDGTYESFNLGATTNTFNVLGRHLRIGYATWDVGGAFPGDIMEVVWYKRALTENEQSRVNTYLAVKNGTTLNENYLSTAGNVVWNRTLNTGYNNNIFGIARDNTTALHQKQAGSTNNGQQLVISTTGLADNNAANSTGLTNDMQYLMTGDNGLRQSLLVPLTYTAGSNGATNYRFESIWKVQNSGSVGTVTVAWPKGIRNLYLVQSPDAAFDGTDTYTPMATEVTVNGTAYNTANVTLADGQFFTFAGFVHAPGGVLAGLEAWHRADTFVYTDAGTTLATSGQTIERWDEFNNSGINFSQPTAARRPIYTPDVMLNFNPSVRFTRSSTQWLSYTFPTSTPKTSGTLYFTGKDNAVGYGSGILGMEESMDYPGWHRMATNNYLMYHVNFTPTLSNPIASQIPNILGASWLNGAGSTASNLLFGTRYNGFAESFNTVSNISLSTNHYRVGQDTNYGAYDGNIGETIYYSRDLGTNEKDRVDSYMAIKYGVTLRASNFGTGTFNYLSSLAAVIWNGTSNATYHNNVFGIANDFTSALHQKQSKSANPNQKLIIGAGSTLFNTNTLNTNSLTDGQFLMVGDNGLKQSLLVPLAYTAGTNGTANYRFESIWKVQNSGSVGTVTVAWPKGVKNLYLVQSPDAAFDGTDTFTPMATEVTVNGTVYNTANVTMSDGQYFTFAGFGNAPAGVVTGLSYWYRADVDATNTGAATDVTAWKDVWNGTTVAQLGANALPKYAVGTSSYFNFNPGINFTAGTQTLGNIAVRTLTSLDYDVFTFTKEGLASGGANPRLFSVGMDNTTTGISNWDAFGVFPNNSNLERRVYNGGTQFPAVAPAFDVNIPSIMYFKNTNTNTSKGLNGAVLQTPTAYVAVNEQFGGHMFGSTIFSSNGSDNAGFIGHIGETIVYGAGTLTTTERRRVDSYLAIKYGITLGQINTDHYLGADGTAVWNGATNTTYNNNVFGMAREDVGLFDQKVSRSVNAGTILTVATTNDFVNPNNNGSRTSFTNDKTYFLLGDNNIATTTLSSITISGYTGVSRIPRTWLAQRTNTSGTMYFESNLSSYGSSFGNGEQVKMIVADDAAFTTNVQIVDGVYNTATAKWVHSYNFDSGNANRYITYATVAKTPFPCDNTAYLLKSNQIFRHNLATGATNATPVASFTGLSNGLGFSPIDNTLWLLVTQAPLATNRAKLTRVDGAGVVTTFDIPNLATALGINPTIADITPTGYFVAKVSSANTGAVGAGVAGSTDGDNYVVIDINPSRPATYLQIVDPANSYALATAPYFKETVGNTAIGVADFTYNPGDGLFYGINNVGNLATLNIVTGVYTVGNALVLSNGAALPVSATYTSTFINAAGSLYTIDGNGNTYRVNIPSGNAALISNAGTISNGDGASCPTAALSHTILGNVFNDTNGLTDGIVNGSGTNVSNTLNAILYNNTTGAVAAVNAVAANGNFAFGAIPGNSYTIYVTTSTATVGQTAVPVLALPTAYNYVGENNCINVAGCAGNDGTANGILSLGVVNADISQANFGINACTQPGTFDAAGLPSTTGISDLVGFTGGTTGWPANVPNGHVVIESKSKGFVITRVSSSAAIVNPVEGMLIYDIAAACVKLYNGTAWKCLAKDCL
ncbi:beta strand repeat-containing protein [Pedobacter sp. SL55]|uniref:beta strand repeat-containing protein n=1 Tax=Pedobacter sp. SL55 TaxID=2995161 RepID=UPI002270F8C7|nr:DUF11 domain-containing protein [Pedobacter sp. SL55]WAC40917.1 DUF11 domain-containing protein [Pedobacter sp. SL55]